MFLGACLSLSLVKGSYVMKAGRQRSTTYNNLKIGFDEGLLATPWVFLSLPGGFIMSALLTVHYGIGPGIYGVIASLPSWASALQIVLVPLISRYMNPRDMALSMSWINLGLWTMLAAVISFLPSEDAIIAGRIFLIFFALAAMSASLIGVGWISWVAEWVPSRIRGKYFGRRNRFISLITTLFLVVSMLTLDLFKDSILAYQLILISAVICRFFSVLWSHQIVTADSDAPVLKASFKWTENIAGLRGNTDFKRMVIFGTLVGFWLAAMGPFYPVFVFELLGWKPSAFAVVTVLATLGGAATMPLWGRMIDRYGCVPSITVSLILWQAQNYLWAFLTPGNDWLLYPMWLWGGSVAGGFFLGTFNLVYKLIPSKSKTAAISLNLAVTSIAAGLAPVLVGVLLDLASKSGFSILWSYRIGFIASPTFILLSLLVLLKIKEPSATARNYSLSGSGRLFRQLMQLQGLSFLANATLFARRKRNGKSRKSE